MEVVDERMEGLYRLIRFWMALVVTPRGRGQVQSASGAPTSRAAGLSENVIDFRDPLQVVTASCFRPSSQVDNFKLSRNLIS